MFSPDGTLRLDYGSGISTAVSKTDLKEPAPKAGPQKVHSTELSGKGTSAQKETGERKTGKSAPAKPKETAHGIRTHLKLLVSSINSLGKIITEQRKKPAKNPEEINKLLEHTITEKVSRVSALESAATVPAQVRIKPGGRQRRYNLRRTGWSPIRS